MEIVNKFENGRQTFVVSGSLDTVTSPVLQAEIDKLDASVTELVFDFSALDYISSAGLRVMLTANKKMLSRGGEMSISGATELVREVFDMTGFSDIIKLV